jgi:hypothetical protein
MFLLLQRFNFISGNFYPKKIETFFYFEKITSIKASNLTLHFRKQRERLS